jgi:hypothetical protein
MHRRHVPFKGTGKMKTNYFKKFPLRITVFMIGAIIAALSCDNVNLTEAYLNITNTYVIENDPEGPFPSDTSIIIKAKDFKTGEIIKNVKVILKNSSGKQYTRKTDSLGYAWFNFKNGITEGDYFILASITRDDIPFFQNTTIHLTKQFNPVITVLLIKGSME